MKTTRAILRYIAAFLVITYGFAKLNGSQFTILDSELDKPMGQVSGFWLTWYYFGYSKFYGNFIALAQIIGGVLLMFRRTTLIGSCLLLPIIANIILVDVFYAIDLGALLVALFIEVALLIILKPHVMELYDLFWMKQKGPTSSEASPKFITIGKYAVRVLLILVPFMLTYWTANYNNRYPTPIDGTWDVVEVSPKLQTTADAPSAVFFERNRAHLSVFKNGDGSYQWHHFEVNPDTRTIAIWQHWLRKGPKMFDGSYELSGMHLQLRGRLASDAEESVITLRRRS
jgi:hypothetical protein